MVTLVSEARDEFLHAPGDRRLWNESYYLDFFGDEVQGFARIGLQPFEDRANVWLYALYDDGIYWFRDENIPIENHYGLSVRTTEYEQRFQMLVPYRKWSITGSGTGRYSTSSAEVFDGTFDEVGIEADLTFADPIHDPYSMKLHVEDQSHYNHAGWFTGEMHLGGSSVEVEATGFRDHSWGWFRDWTPGEWGHYYAGLQFESGDCFMFAVQVRPDGGLRNGHGYRSTPDSVADITEVDVRCVDGLSKTERPLEWAEGNIPEEIICTLETVDGEDEIHLTPKGNVPLGYEDRNWELTDPDGPWLQSVLNRMPVETMRDGDRGTGWLESSLPL